MCCSPWGHKESDMTEQLNLASFHVLIGRLYVHLGLLPIFQLDCLFFFVIELNELRKLFLT